MDFKNLLLIIVCLVSLMLSFLIVRGKKDKTNVSFALFILSIAIWAVGIAFFRISETIEASLLFAKIYYVAAAAIPTFFLYFSLVFQREHKTFSLKKNFLIFVPLISLILLFLTQRNFLIKDIIIYGWGKSVVFQKFDYLMYSFFFVSFLLFSYFNLLKTYLSKKKESVLLKKQFHFIFGGTIIPYLLAMYFNLFLPWTNYKYIWIGPLFATMVAISVVYTITKHHFVGTKVITTEIFSGLLFIFLFVQFALSDSEKGGLVNGFVFIGFSIFAILLIKSVLNEVRAKEQLAKLSNDLKKANSELKKLDQAKSEFLSIASHQLRTPITVIKGYTSMLLEGDYGKLPQKATETINKVFQSSNRLAMMIEDFLNISRIEMGRMKYEFDNFDLKKVAEDIIADFLDNNSKAKSLDIKFESQGTNFEIYADKNKITQVLSNLIDNSVKYTPKGFINISLHKTQNDNAVLFQIEDSGVGIPQETLPQLFTKFTRAKDISRLHTGGTGLGLFVAKKIVESHKGKIWAKSEGVGKGSAFFVELPVHPGKRD
ncbi:MAG: hypothetical protein K9M15_01950 [Candidatus Marinimicrobia bacterium]|nr:hypothetical protein [Candidatus Neomarinimicrobiota bacterium]